MNYLLSQLKEQYGVEIKKRCPGISSPIEYELPIKSIPSFWIHYF